MGRRAPAAPEYLDDDARALWARLAPSLHAAGVLTTWDVDLLAAYCTAAVHHRRAVDLVNKTNVLIQSSRDRGVAVKHPALQVVRDQAAIMAAIGGRFGLTPADRLPMALAQAPTAGKEKSKRDELKERRVARAAGRGAAAAPVASAGRGRKH